MSFLAVVGLVAFYDAWQDWTRSREGATSFGSGWRMWLARSWRSFLVGIATTLVAGTLSTIPAAYHFGRISPFSLLANLLAMPVIGLIIMPMAVVSILAMPFGLEFLPLQIMGKGLSVLLAISDWVSGLSGARLQIPTLPLNASLALAVGAFIVCFGRGHLRLAGFTLVPLAVVLAIMRPQPDILVERTASNVAIRGGNGRLDFVNGRRGRFAAEKWLQANGEEVSRDLIPTDTAWICTGVMCEATVRGRRIAYAEDESALASGCPAVDVLIARFPLRRNCTNLPLTIDRFDVWRNGSYALYVTGEGIVMRTAKEGRGKRPWTADPVARRDLDKEVEDGVQ